MDLNKIDKKILKRTLKEVIKEDFKSYRGLIKEVIRELLSENQLINNETADNRRKRLEALIDEDFDRYDEVFKALA